MSRVIVRLRSDFKKKNGEAAVLLHIHLRNKKVVLPTGISVHPDKWSSENIRIKGSSKEVKDDNLVINNCIARVNDIIVRYRLQNKELTPSLLKTEYKNPAVFLDFFEFCAKEISFKKGVAAGATIKAHSSAIEKLKNYRNPLMFSEINYDLITGFYRHMKTVLKNNDNTASKSLTVIKSYLNLAVKKKILSENPFPGDLQTRKASINRVYLLPEEFQKLVMLYRKRRFSFNLHRVLRYFLFSCCTGLRISDIKAIKWRNISRDILIYSPVKTMSRGKIVRIPLVKFAMELMGPESQDKNERIFDAYSDQVTNRYLKEIAGQAGIKKKITSHTGRHTFATLYLRHSKNLAGLKELMGHTDIAQTMVYAHIIYEDIQKDMGVFDQLAGPDIR